MFTKSCDVRFPSGRPFLGLVSNRYTLGNRIDTLHIELIESLVTAACLPKSDKVPYVRMAIRKTDTLKLLYHIAWETRSLDTKKYTALSVSIDEVGRMLGGWYGQLTTALPKT